MRETIELYGVVVTWVQVVNYLWRSCCHGYMTINTLIFDNYVTYLIDGLNKSYLVI